MKYLILTHFSSILIDNTFIVTFNIHKLGTYVYTRTTFVENAYFQRNFQHNTKEYKKYKNNNNNNENRNKNKNTLTLTNLRPAIK